MITEKDIVEILNKYPSWIETSEYNEVAKAIMDKIKEEEKPKSASGILINMSCMYWYDATGKTAVSHCEKGIRDCRDCKDYKPKLIRSNNVKG